MLGGGGEKKTLLLVARYADACNLFGTGVEEVAHKLAVLRAHCAAEGRDYEAIEKTVMYSRRPVSAHTDELLAELALFAELGVTEIQLTPDGHPVEFVEKLAQRILPAAAQIG